MGPLEPAAAQAALVHPAEHEGVEFQESAVSEILRATQGYPYFLQEWGFHVWNAAQKSPIRAADVERVTPEIIAHLDQVSVVDFWRWRLFAAIALARIGVVGVCAQAADSPYDWKLTLGEYFYSNYAGSDVNLRWRASDTSVWIGAYADSAFGSQFRTGADTSLQVAKYLQLQPSVQLATRGFVGGSLNVQVGGAWYGLVGIGRTDARPYFNLNFDPNDA